MEQAARGRAIFSGVFRWVEGSVDKHPRITCAQDISLLQTEPLSLLPLSAPRHDVSIIGSTPD